MILLEMMTLHDHNIESHNKFYTTMNTETQDIKLLNLIAQANDAQVDSIWAILKYKEIGIYRKIACICEVLSQDMQEMLNDLPQDEEGRILDYKTRHMIHDTLIAVS